MKYNDVNEVLKLLRGETGYFIPEDRFEVGRVQPTNIFSVMRKHIYTDVAYKPLFESALITLANGSVADVYLSFLYFDTCMFYQREGIAIFEIDSVRIRQIISDNIKTHRNELKGEIVFSNGICTKKAWETIERLNKYYIEKSHFSFI